MLKQLMYIKRILTLRPKRYRNLLRTVYEGRCRRILEVGTYDGKHATQMIETANIFFPRQEIEYYGFDLFDALTDDELIKEASKMPPAYEVVKQKLEKSGAKIRLYMGYSHDTLPGFIKENRQIDLIFIDGGHSIETISSDWNNVKKIMRKNTIVIFDDYYNNQELEVKGIGCQTIIEDLDRNTYQVEMLKPQDCFEKEWGTLRVNMVKVRLK